MEIAQVLTRAYELGLFSIINKHLHSTGIFGASGISSRRDRCSRLSAIIAARSFRVNLALSNTRRWIPTGTFPPVWIYYLIIRCSIKRTEVVTEKLIFRGTSFAQGVDTAGDWNADWQPQ
jgi:hypothetical protein